MQLGLRGDTLRRYAAPAAVGRTAEAGSLPGGGAARGDAVDAGGAGGRGGSGGSGASGGGGCAGIVRIEGVSARVGVERTKLDTPAWRTTLCTPRERVYQPATELAFATRPAA